MHDEDDETPDVDYRLLNAVLVVLIVVMVIVAASLFFHRSSLG